MNDNIIREIARQSFLGYERVHALEDGERRRLEAEGYRLVNGGQSGGYDDGGKSDWEIHDFRTGELLIRGHGTYDDYSVAVDREESARGERWYDAGNIWHDLDMPVPERPDVDGIPSSLGEVIYTWVADSTPEDVAAFTGFSVERVRSAFG